MPRPLGPQPRGGIAVADERARQGVAAGVGGRPDRAGVGGRPDRAGVPVAGRPYRPGAPRAVRAWTRRAGRAGVATAAAARTGPGARSPGTGPRCTARPSGT